MRVTSTIAGVFALTSAAFAKEEAVNEVLAKEFYDSGIAHERIMHNKNAFWDYELEAGLMNSSLYPAWDGKVQCKGGFADATALAGGKANHNFKCRNIDLYSFKPHDAIGCNGAQGSGSWGWTDPTSKREFVAHGCYEGTSFLEIKKDGSLVWLGFLTSYAPPAYYSRWHEIRNSSHYFVIASELERHGVQVFDARKLLDITEEERPVYFNGANATGATDLTSHIDVTIYGRSHNIHAHRTLPYIATMGHGPRLTGEPTCQSGLIYWDLTDPAKPKRLGCSGQDGYVHDVECLIYNGPHTKYVGTDICYGYNEDTLTIYNVTDKANTVLISRTSYTGASYTHQGEVLDKNWQQYIILDDETDEVNSRGPASDRYPVTYIWDISNLEAPKQTGIYKANTQTIDHNQYVIGDYVYQSNYGSGLRVYDISSIPKNSRGTDVCEVAYVDIYPEDDTVPGGGIVQYSGTWSHYPYFPSGYIYISSIERGGFVAKKAQAWPKCTKTCNADTCLRTLRASEIPGRLEESQEFCSTFTKTFVTNVTQVIDYAVAGCTGNVISRVSSACGCLPTA